jgi:hypothetical protein
MAVVASGLLVLAGCTTLPAAARQQEMPRAQAVEFENARGPVSANKGAAILEELKNESGDIEILQKHLALEQAINADSPLVLGNKLVLLQDGPATYKAMFAAIRMAKDHINLETYIFEDDDVGKQFAELLLERQAAGVQVNLIYDSVGCLNTPKEFFERLAAAGIQVLEFNPVNPLAGNKKEWLLNNRDHRKLLVVDGRSAFLGGINISESYSSSPSSRSSRRKTAKPAGWRDTHLQVEGPVVAEFQRLFMDTWTKQRGKPLPAKKYFPRLDKQGDEIVRAIGSASADPHSLIYLTLLSAITHAEQRVYLTNAYFVPDPQFLETLTAARCRRKAGFAELQRFLGGVPCRALALHQAAACRCQDLRAARRGHAFQDRLHRRCLVNDRFNQSGLAQLSAQRRTQRGDSGPRLRPANGRHVCQGSGRVRGHRPQSLEAPVVDVPIEGVGGAARGILAVVRSGRVGVQRPALLAGRIDRQPAFIRTRSRPMAAGDRTAAFLLAVLSLCPRLRPHPVFQTLEPITDAAREWPWPATVIGNLSPTALRCASIGAGRPIA